MKNLLKVILLLFVFNTVQATQKAENARLERLYEKIQKEFREKRRKEKAPRIHSEALLAARALENLNLDPVIRLDRESAQKRTLEKRRPRTR